jgi:hypothetical protein
MGAGTDATSRPVSHRRVGPGISPRAEHGNYMANSFQFTRSARLILVPSVSDRSGQTIHGGAPEIVAARENLDG